MPSCGSDRRLLFLNSKLGKKGVLNNMHSSLRRMEYNREDYLWAGNTPIFYAQTFPAISSASLRTSFFLYVFAFPSNVSLAPRTSSKPWRDDSHAGDRYTDRASVASNRYANYQQTSEAIKGGTYRHPHLLPCQSLR